MSLTYTFLNVKRRHGAERCMSKDEEELSILVDCNSAEDSKLCRKVSKDLNCHLK